MGFPYLPGCGRAGHCMVSRGAGLGVAQQGAALTPAAHRCGDRTLPGLPRPLVSVLSHVLTGEGSLQMLLNASPQHPSRGRPLVLLGCSTLARSRLQGKGRRQACCMHCCASCCVHRHDPAPGLGNAALQGMWGDMTDHRADVSSRLTGKGSRLLAPGTLSHPA